MCLNVLSIRSVLLIALALGSWSIGCEKAGMTSAASPVSASPARWEYKMVKLAKIFGDDVYPANEKLLNSLGAEGWELVSYSDVFVFKRPKK